MKRNNKTMLVIIALFLIIVLSGILTLYYLNASADKLEKSVDSALASVSSKQWDLADQYLKDFGERWNSTKFSWAVLLDHFEIDNIDNSYVKAKKFIESQEYPSALAELDALKQYIEHIPKKESFSLENIL